VLVVLVGNSSVPLIIRLVSRTKFTILIILSSFGLDKGLIAVNILCKNKLPCKSEESPLGHASIQGFVADAEQRNRFISC
jgi:hypothetical protein